MIFQHTYAQVLDGTKTQTRRLAAMGERSFGSEPSDFCVERNFRLLWETGRTYAVQPGRGKSSVGTIRIRAIRREFLQDITEADAKAEGVQKEYGSYRNPFIRLWDTVHGKSYQNRWSSNPEVWVLEFELVK